MFVLAVRGEATDSDAPSQALSAEILIPFNALIYIVNFDNLSVDNPEISAFFCPIFFHF
jgi:hypothetical protein